MVLHAHWEFSASGTCADLFTCVHNIHMSSHRAPDLDTCVQTFPSCTKGPWQSCPCRHSDLYKSNTHYSAHLVTHTNHSVDMYRYWHRHYTHTQTLQRWLDLLRIRHTHRCSCYQGQTHTYRKKHTSTVQWHMWTDTCIQSHTVPDVYLDPDKWSLNCADSHMYRAS